MVVAPRDQPNLVDPTHRLPVWAAPEVKAFLDAFQDAVVVSGVDEIIAYANPSAEEFLGWPAGELAGQPVSAIVPPSLREWLPSVRADALTDLRVLAGRRLRINSRRCDGSEVATELVLSVIGPDESPMLVAGLRPRGIAHLSRWSELTAMLFDTLGNADPEQSAEYKVLEVLGRLLGWDVTALWALAADGDLECRAVWVDSASEYSGRLAEARTLKTGPQATLAYHVLESGEPLWIPDLPNDDKLADGPAARAGLRTAVVFPIRYGGSVVGVAELFSQEPRPGDPELVDLVRAVSRPVGELLGALELAAERERTLRQLEKARARQDFLLQATRLVSQVSDYATTLRRLAEVAVPVLGDLCLIDLLDDSGRIERMVCHHRDPSRAALCQELERDFSPDPGGPHPTIEVVRSGHSRWSGTMSDDFLRATTRDERHYQIVRELGFQSYMAVPLVAVDKVLGTVTLVSTTPGMQFDEDDLEWAEQLAIQVASVIARAQRHHREEEISHVIQRSLLPERLPKVEGIELAARYLPATRWTEVGGDWYDVITDGIKVALVVGDVEGHDVRAAALMGKLRHGLSLLLSQDQNPADVLGRLNHFVLGSDLDRLATVVIAVIDTATGFLEVASAGHLPPVLRTVTGSRVLSVRPGPPIGVPGRDCEAVRLALGFDELVLFTDGLVEIPASGIEDRLAELSAAVARGPAGDPEALADWTVASMLPGDDRLDDVAIMVASIRLTPASA